MTLNKSKHAVAISGAGCLCAAGRNVSEALTGIDTGGPAPHRPTTIDEDFKTQFKVHEIPDHWIGGDGPVTKALRCNSMVATVTSEALHHAGLEPSELHRARVGICLGTVVGAALVAGNFHRSYHAGEHPDPTPVLDFLHANPSDALARALDVTGPTLTVATACTSGALAIAEGAAWIRSGLCDVVIAGGVETINHLSYSGFVTLKLTDPERCRPFDRRRQGLILGEAAGIVVLESTSHLRARDASAWSTLVGDGNASDAFHLSRPNPDGRGLKRAIDVCLDRCASRPDEFAFINAHGTGTRDNDLVEGSVLAEVMPGVPFFSCKGATGHCLGAAGALEAVLTAAWLERGVIPASAGFEEFDPEIGVQPVAERTAIDGSLALSTAVGYGGSNVVLAIKAGDHV